MKRLEIEQQIEQQTCSKNRLVTIKNWSKYQGVNNKTTTSEQPVNTNNKGNNEIKKIYSEFVELTDKQFTTLITKYGDDITDTYIEKLNNYLGSTGKKYKSHYHTILSWLRKDKVQTLVEKNMPFDTSIKYD